MADEYSTPIPQGATVGTPQTQPTAQPQSAVASQSQDEYTAPIPKDATIGDTLHTQATPYTGLAGGMPLMQAVRENPANKQVYDMATGFVKGAGQTVNTVSGALSHVVPSVVPPNEVAGLSSMEQPSNQEQTAGLTAESLGEFFLGDEALKGLSLAQKYAKASKFMEMIESSDKMRRAFNLGMQSLRQGTVAGVQAYAHGATPTQAVETGLEGTGAGLVAGTAAEAIPAGWAKITHFFSPETGTLHSVEDNPGLLKQLRQGEKVAQPKAQQAVRSAIQTSTDAAGTTDATLAENIAKQPLLGQGKTILDDHLSRLQGQEQAAYNEMDKTAGFDVKAEKQTLSNDKYKLQQLGNTDADVTQRGNLVESINDSEDRIAAAEAKMQAAGVDPGAADAIHKQRMAGQEFKKILVNNSDGQNINVDGLLTASKKLRLNSKYGDRLAQFFGSTDAANKFETDLLTAQRAGQKALAKQNVAKIIGKYVGLPLLGTGAGTAVYEAIHTH